MDLKQPDPADEADRVSLDDEDDVVFEFEEITDPDDPSVVRARADFAAGRFLTNDQVRAWLTRWIGEGPLPPYPRPWLR